MDTKIKISLLVVAIVFVACFGMSFQEVLACQGGCFEFPKPPEIPELPELPQIPECPNLPECPGVPEIPEIPEIPELPCPQCPSIPTCPQYPICPVCPACPTPLPCPPEPPTPPEPPVPLEVPGCTDSEALNYNSEATVDDESCQYPESEPETPSIPPSPSLATSSGGGGGGYRPPILKITKSVSEKFTNPGATITYTIVIKNTGSGVARNLVLKETLPDGFTFKETELSEREWQLGDLDVDETKTITYEVKVSESVEEGEYKNIAELTASNHTSLTAEATIEVRLPEVKGEEIFLEEKPEEVLPHTGESSFANFVFLSLAILAIGLLGILSIFLKKYRATIQLVLFGILVIGGFTVLIYAFLPQITFTVAEYTPEYTPVKIKFDGDYLVIPKIGVEIPIVRGEDESALDRGAWLMPKSSLPGSGGNTVLAGHRFKYKPPHKETFYLLDKLGEGDLIQVFWQGKEYDYQVVWSKVVDPKAVEILEETPEPSLTLITCHPLFSDKQRLIVRSKLL